MDLLFYNSPVGRLGLIGEGDALTALTLPNQPVPLIAEQETPGTAGDQAAAGGLF